MENEENLGSSVVVKYKSTIGLGLSVMKQFFLSYLLCLLFFSVSLLSDNLAVSIFLQLLQLAIVFSFPYGIMWYEGDRDRNLVKYNRISYDPLRGLKVGVIASSPVFLSYIILILAYFSQNQLLYIIYRVLNFPFLNIIMWITGYTKGSVAFLTDLRWYHTIILIIIPIFTIIPSVLGYRFGYKKFSIGNTLTFKGEKRKDSTEKNTKNNK